MNEPVLKSAVDFIDMTFPVSFEALSAPAKDYAICNKRLDVHYNIFVLFFSNA